MPKTKLSSDIDEILAKSQRLTSHLSHGISSSRNLNRGVVELSEASKQFTQHVAATEEKNFDTYRLLSQKNFDAEKMYQDIHSLLLPRNDESNQRLEGTDIEGYLAHHHDMIILTAIEDAKKSSEEHIQEQQRRWATEEWNTAKAQFMSSIGHRAHRWKAYHERSTDPSLNASLHQQSPAVNELLYGGAVGTPNASSFGKDLIPPAIYSAASKLSFQTPAKTLTAPLHPPSAARPLLSPLFEQHANIIRNMNLSSHRQAAPTISNSQALTSLGTEQIVPFSDLYDSIVIPEQGARQSLVSEGMSKGDLIAYKTLLDFLAHCVGEVKALTNPDSPGVAPGFFSPICFEDGAITPSLQEERRVILSSGAIVFLEQQILEIWSKTLKGACERGEWSENSLAASNPVLSFTTDRLRSFVAYQYHIGVFPHVCGKAITAENVASQNNAPCPLWAMVYYSLRVGRVLEAKEELSATAAFGSTEAAAATVLYFIERLLKSSNSTSSDRRLNTGVVKLTDTERHDLHVALEHCEGEYQKGLEALSAEEATAEEDPFRLLVLNLLTLVDKESLAGSSVPGFSLEDFLWSHLWFIRLSRCYTKNRVTYGDKTSSPLKKYRGMLSVQSNSANYFFGENELFEIVQECGGADYFDQGRRAPYRFATVLCCCQRFGDAVAHLWSAQQYFAAAHLAVVGLHYGLILPHRPLIFNPPHPSVAGNVAGYTNSSFDRNAAAAGGVESMLSGEGGVTPFSVLQEFVTSVVVRNYADVCVDYLISVDSNWRTHTQGLDSEVRRVQVLKSETTVNSLLEQFITSLEHEQLRTVVGVPINPAPTSKGRGLPRTPARLDDYLDSVQIESLLAHAAYHLLTQRNEVEAAVHLYQLAGRYSEVLEELCEQLGKCLFGPAMPPAPLQPLQQQHVQVQHHLAQQRLHWRGLCQSFLDRYMNGHTTGHQESTSSVYFLLSQAGHRDLIDSFLLLMGLFPVVDAYQQLMKKAPTATPDQVLGMLDALKVLPTKKDQVERFSTAMRPQLRRVLDDLLVMALETTKLSFSRNPPHAAALKARAAALLQFTQVNKNWLQRAEVLNIAVRIESSML